MVFTFWLLFPPQRQGLESVLIQDKIVSETFRAGEKLKWTRPALTWSLNLWSASLLVALCFVLKYLQWRGTNCHLSCPFRSWRLGSSPLSLNCSQHFLTKPCVGTKRTSQTWQGYPVGLITFLPSSQIFCLQAKHFRGIWNFLQERELQDLDLSLSLFFKFLQRKPNL